MAHRWEEHWPLFGLSVRTPRVELRVVNEESAYALLDVASSGIHPPEFMPFTFPWTDEPDGVRQQNSLRHYWRTRAELSPAKWMIEMAVHANGELVGSQALLGEEFPKKRVASSGSWLAQEHQGKGLGKEMRAAIVHLAFAGLGAVRCESAAFEDNAASRAVSLGLGYEENGDGIALRRGEPARLIRYKLERAVWEQRRRDDIVIDGLDAALPMLGLSASPDQGSTAEPT